MASLQKKGDSWHCQFLFKKQRRTWVIGSVEEIEAKAIKAKVEYLLMRIKQHLIDLPPGMDIITFIQHDGKPPDIAPTAPQERTFAQIRDAWIRTHSNGTIEQNTLATCKLHLSHFATTLGEKFIINGLTLADLQRHVDRRAKAKSRNGTISPVTIKKEIATLSGVWIWAARMGFVMGVFPGQGLRYPKMEEPPPFMTWAEVERGIAAGGSSDLWDSLFLTLPEIAALLQYAKEHATYPFVYPMFCFAAFTGARRSEMLRAQITDLDWQGNTVIIREKKRVRGKRTSRRVPMTPFLRQVLEEWLKVHPGGQHLFCLPDVVERSRKRSSTTGHKGEKTRASGEKARKRTVKNRERQPITLLSRKESYYHFVKTLEGSRWEVLRGWHLLRHSFISACASRGIDQRLIDEWSGHSTEEQRKRYRHLAPSTQHAAINLVFG